MLFKIVSVVAAIAVGVASVQTWRLEASRSDAIELRTELRTCGARLNNLVEDIQSDAEVDSLTDDDLTSVPEHWLRPIQPD